jgi:hypothetical protein
MDYLQPWFDESGGVYPVYHVFKGLAALRGKPLIDLTVSKPREIQAIAAATDDGVEVWIANLTDRLKTVELVPELTGKVAVLTAAEFESATRDFSAMNSLERGFADQRLSLAPYAVARLRSRTH